MGSAADQGAALEQDHAVADRQQGVEVVRAQQDRGAAGPLGQQHLRQLLAAAGVERRERLVEQQELGPAGQGPGQRDPLGHAA